MKLDIKSFALTTALFWGFGLFLITWWIIMMDGVSNEPTIIARVYRGYNISPIGSFIGFSWAFIDGLFGGAVFAWLYNFIYGRLFKKN